MIFSKNDAEESRSFYFRKENVDEKIRFRYKLSGYLINPNRFRFRKVVRILALVLTFIRKISKNIDKIKNHKLFQDTHPGELAKILEPKGDKYIITTGTIKKTRDLVFVGVLNCRIRGQTFSEKRKIRQYLKRDRRSSLLCWQDTPRLWI